MEVFNFPFHVPKKKFPENSAIVNFGRGYQFASEPKGPPQIIYTLSFRTMVWFTTPFGTINTNLNPRLNMSQLEEFYSKHQMFKKFIYPSLTDGDVVVRFNKPLEWRLAEGGLGTVDPFEVELISQP